METRPTPRQAHARLLHSRNALALALGFAVLLGVAGAWADDEESSPPTPAPDATTGVDADADARPDPDAQLSGREIYEKLLENRFDAYTQDLVMNSGDRGGNIQATEMSMKYLNFRDMDDRVLSKSIMKYSAPQDVRHLGYLVINKADGSEDQFVYRPSSRRVRRINLRGEAIFGTDFAFEDIIPQELENATYARKADAELDGLPVYVVEVTPVAEQDSEYSKFDVYITRDQFVALKVLYWDRDGVEIKELSAEPDSITHYVEKGKDDPKTIWIANRQKIRHLKLGSWTELSIANLESSKKLKKKDFSERELARGN